jgi:hypothetical protein
MKSTHLDPRTRSNLPYEIGIVTIINHTFQTIDSIESIAPFDHCQLRMCHTRQSFLVHYTPLRPLGRQHDGGYHYRDRQDCLQKGSALSRGRREILSKRVASGCVAASTKIIQEIKKLDGRIRPGYWGREIVASLVRFCHKELGVLYSQTQTRLPFEDLSAKSR